MEQIDPKTGAPFFEILVTAGVARLTGSSPAVVRRAIRAGHLPAWRPGGRYLIHIENAKEWAERRSRKAA